MTIALVPELSVPLPAEAIEEALALPELASNVQAHTCYARGDWNGLRTSFAAVSAPYSAPAYVAKRDIGVILYDIGELEKLITASGNDGVLCYCTELDELEEELIAARKTLVIARARFSLDLLTTTAA